MEKKKNFFLVFTKGKKEKSVSFYWTYVCVRAILSFVSFFLFFFYESFLLHNQRLYAKYFCVFPWWRIKKPPPYLKGEKAPASPREEQEFGAGPSRGGGLDPAKREERTGVDFWPAWVSLQVSIGSGSFIFGCFFIFSGCLLSGQERKKDKHSDYL